MSRDDGRDVVAAFLGLGFGVYHFFKGFERLRLKRRIEGLATSKVRSMAMGTVELEGRAQLIDKFLDPIYEQPCAFYRLEVQEYKGGKNKRWVTIHSEDSGEKPFYLEDETGRVPVFPAGCELQAYRDVDGQSKGGGNSEVKRFLSRYGGDGIFDNNLRVLADIIRPGDPVHLVGFAVPSDHPHTLSDRIQRPIHELARRLKADVARMRKLDLDRDGRISAFEWDIGLEAYRREQEKAPPPEELAAPAALVRADPDGFLFISDRLEKDCLSDLGSRANLGIFGGPALAVACAAYLAARLGLLASPF